METRAETVTSGRMVTRELADWIASLRYDDLPPSVTEEAGRVLADYLGESLFVGAMKPWGQAITAFCAAEGGGQPDATIIATGVKTLSSRAAFANGTLALGFEYADFVESGRPYPYAVTAPLALAETRHRSGKDLIVGIVVGYEVMARIGRAVFHPGALGNHVNASGALYGTFGSTAGAMSVLGLSPQNATYGLGLAAAFTGGTFQGHEEGAWQRSLNGGMASQRGVTAALMAERGFKASEMGLEGAQGFAATFFDGTLDPSALFDGLGESFVISNRWVKPYPMNLTLHAPVEALLALMRAHDLQHTDIEAIDAAWQKVEPFLGKHTVKTVVSAQASLPFALAVAAVRGVATGKVGIDDFTEETVADPDVQAMIRRISVHQDTELYAQAKGSMPGKVTLRTKDGRELTGEVLFPKGNPANRLTEDEFERKYMEMASRVLGDVQADELYRRARDLDGVGDVADLAALFSPREASALAAAGAEEESDG